MAGSLIDLTEVIELCRSENTCKGGQDGLVCIGSDKSCYKNGDNSTKCGCIEGYYRKTPDAECEGQLTSN